MDTKIWIAAPRGLNGGIFEFDPATGTTVKLFSTPSWHLDGIAIYRPPGPEIKLDPEVITASVWIAEGNPRDSVFTVTNNGSGTLDYTINDDADWLTVTPDSGSSTGSPHSHTMSFDADGKLGGTYDATIAVAGNAWNTDKYIAVSMTIRTVGPDVDGDGDVDQRDFGLFQVCLTQPGQTVQPPCDTADFNHDGLVNQGDMTTFVDCLSGPGVLADKTCDPSA